MPYHMSSAPPSEGATCSPWPFEKPWGLHVCPTPCPRRPHCSGATCSSWPFGKPWGLSFFTHVLSASCLARADPHTTARAPGSSPPCSPHSSQGPGESSSDEHFQGRHACSLTPGAAPSRPTRACPCLPSVRAPRHCGAMPPFSRSFGRPLALWASRGTPWRLPRSVALSLRRATGPHPTQVPCSRCRTRCQRDSASYSSEGPGASSSTSGS